MKIISGKTGTPHVTSAQFRQIIEGIIGQESYILKSGENMEPELASNNMLKIRGGVMSHHGNVSGVDLNTYDEVTIKNGSQGMKRIDLIVNRYTRSDETGIEKNEWVVLTGTPDQSSPKVPGHIVGNLQNGDLTDDCPVFKVHLEGIQVTNVEKLLPVLEGDLASLNSNLIQSGTELVPNANGYFAIKNITFPVPYAEIPNVTATVSNGDNNDSLEANIFSQVGRVSKTGCVLKVCCWNEKLAGSKFKVSWIAVGRREL